MIYSAAVLVYNLEKSLDDLDVAAGAFDGGYQWWTDNCWKLAK